MTNILARFIVCACAVTILAMPAVAQSVRNPVLEYSSGTWCGWCPCGHAIIGGTILPNIPNAIIIGYHGPANGSDPYSFFAGNSIINDMFGFAGYPSGVVDRTTGVIPRADWFTNMNSRQSVSPTVHISIGKTYNATTRTLNATIFVQALTTLNGQFMLSFILLESNLVYPQAGYSDQGCFGGNNYVHNNVVRAMINGERGDSLNSSPTWNTGETISRTYSYTVDGGIVDANATIVALVYRVGASLNTSEIQQAEKWTLPGTIIVPVQLASFTATVVNASNVLLEWTTLSEVNNFGFFIQKRRASEVAWSEIPNSFIPGHGTTLEPHYYSFTDATALAGHWQYRLKQVDLDGTVHFTEPVSVNVLTGVAENSVPDEFRLEQNYPNPFNPTTEIRYHLPALSAQSGQAGISEVGHVTLKVVDVLGREVATIVNEQMQPGSYEVKFDASNLPAGRHGLPSGVYLYRLTAGWFSQARKMILTK